MTLKHFKIQEIGELDDGRVAAMINKCIRSVVDDCANRPGVTESRSVGVRFEVVPLVGEEAVCTEVIIEVVASTSLPKSRSKAIAMGVRPQGMLVFNSASVESVRQGTLDQAADGIQDPPFEYGEE